MKRVQVQFTDDDAFALRERATRSGRPVASLVRDAVGAWLASDQRRLVRDRAGAAIGGFHSGLGDLAEHHDKYVEQEGR
jgi:hypothetical protein